ncbi:MAG TPA: hypothetical protein VFT74_02995 [Isosphaeraceae bacterium]|nr:hypothetical protein [Isosphaeraceae bacterium]
MFAAIWSILTFPFRVIGWLVSALGRVAGFVIGFAFMVVGIALSAGALFPFGIPLFIVGLMLTLRSLG